STVAASAVQDARDAFPVSPVIATRWELGKRRRGDQPGFDEAFLAGGAAPKARVLFHLPPHAITLVEIPDTHGYSFYRVELAQKTVAFASEHRGAMTEDDLPAHHAAWCGTIAQPFSR